MELTDRLSNIVERLQQKGVEDISDHDAVEKLLQSLDDSFDSLVATIKERSDYENLRLDEVMELLIVHEEQLEKERGQADSSSEEEGEILSDYGSSNEERI